MQQFIVTLGRTRIKVAARGPNQAVIAARHILAARKGKKS